MVAYLRSRPPGRSAETWYRFCSSDVRSFEIGETNLQLGTCLYTVRFNVPLIWRTEQAGAIRSSIGALSCRLCPLWGHHPQHETDDRMIDISRTIIIDLRRGRTPNRFHPAVRFHICPFRRTGPGQDYSDLFMKT